MKLKQNLSALLAAVMLAGMPAAGAAASPVVEYDTLGQFAELTLTGLPADTQVHSVQLELTLDGLYPKEPLLDEFSTGVSLSKIEHGENKTTLTIYIDSVTALGSGQDIPLGTLEFQDPVSSISFDKTGRLTLLNERQERIDGSLSQVTVRRMSDTGPDNSGSSGGNTSGGSTSGNSTSGGSSSRPTSDSSDNTHTTSVSKTGNGTVKVSPSDAEEGDTVTITATPDSGYILQSISAYDSRGKELSLNERGDGTYTFIMPDSKVTIEAVFAAAQMGPLPFTDVPEREWYYSAASYVYRYGMMSGTSPTAFSPEMTTNRAMIVSILHRLEGSPAAGGVTFPDIADGQYYTAAVAWAASNGIVSGYSNGLFRPDDIITREQFASILYRYAQYKGYPMIAPAALSSFPDAAEVSGYASGPMGWAVAQGLISGTNRGLLNPAGGATRAQAASILMRFCQALANMP